MKPLTTVTETELKATQLDFHILFIHSINVLMFLLSNIKTLMVYEKEKETGSYAITLNFIFLKVIIHYNIPLHF